MAILPHPSNHFNPFAQEIGDDLVPEGTFIATVLKIKDEFGVTRKKYESTVLEKVDLTCFLFGFRDPKGNPHRIASKPMKISGDEKSNLWGTLKSVLGRAPAFELDTYSLIGTKCLLTVEHKKRREGNGVYAAIATLSPVPAGLSQSLPAFAEASAGGQPVVAAPAVTVLPVCPAPPAAPVSAPPAAAPSVTAPENDIPF